MTIAITALNGKIPVALLRVIDAKGHLLRPDAAASLALMRADGCPGGAVVTAYRTLEEQQELWDTLGWPTAQPPGNSFHGEAIAVDFTPTQYTWVRKWGRPYGWRFPIPAEPWHGVYDPDLQTKWTPNTAPVTIPPVPVAEPVEEPDMKLFRIIEDGRIMLAGPNTWRQIQTMAEVNTMITVYGLGPWTDIHIQDGQNLDNVLTAPNI